MAQVNFRERTYLEMSTVLCVFEELSSIDQYVIYIHFEHIPRALATSFASSPSNHNQHFHWVLTAIFSLMICLSSCHSHNSHSPIKQMSP